MDGSRIEELFSREEIERGYINQGEMLFHEFFKKEPQEWEQWVLQKIHSSLSFLMTENLLYALAHLPVHQLSVSLRGEIAAWIQIHLHNPSAELCDFAMDVVEHWRTEDVGALILDLKRPEAWLQEYILTVKKELQEEWFEQAYQNWHYDLELKIMSSIDTNHPAYQQMKRWGKDVLPTVLSKLDEEPILILMLLAELTGENPISEEHRGRVSLMIQDWKNWSTNFEQKNDNHS